MPLQMKPNAVSSPVAVSEIHISENVSQADFAVAGQFHFEADAVLCDVYKFVAVSVRRDQILHRVIIDQGQHHCHDRLQAVRVIHADDCLIPVKHFPSEVAFRDNVIGLGARAGAAVIILRQTRFKWEGMIRIVSAAADIRADEAFTVIGQSQFRRQVVPTRGGVLRDLAPRARQGVFRRIQRQSARFDSFFKIDRSVLNAFEQFFQIFHVIVGNVDLLIKQLGDLYRGAHLRDLQDLRRSCALAVDGDLADVIAVCDAIRKSGKLNRLAVLADIEIHHFSIIVNKPCGVHRLQVLFCACLVAAIKFGKRRHKQIRYACRKGGYGSRRDHAQHHYQRQKHTKYS